MYTGTPWWVSIIATTVLIRAIQLPFYVKVSDNGAKMKEAAPFAAPIVEDMKNAHAKKNLVAVHLARQQLKDLYEKAGVRKSWMFFPLAQIPVFFGIYNLLRNMSELPVPGLLDGGVAWFTDLTSADPYMILPIFTSTVMAYSIHVALLSSLPCSSYKLTSFAIIDRW